MIIIPERKLVCILVPRTGSGLLRRAVAKRYPKSFLLYRHMEADGVPLGYDRWPRFGFVRDPFERLWSLYRFIRDLPRDCAYPQWRERVQQSLRSLSFQHWIVNNKIPFTDPYGDGTEFYPEFNLLHPKPEAQKSQFEYLRPDLGTHVVAFEYLSYVTDWLELDIRDKVNCSKREEMPKLGSEAEDQIRKVCAWDLEAHEKALQNGYLEFLDGTH